MRQRQDSCNELEWHVRQHAEPLREDRTTRRLEQHAARNKTNNTQKLLQRSEHTTTSRPASKAHHSVLLPFRGQVRVATRASKVLHEKASIGAVCCVSPGTGELVLLDADDLTQALLCVPLEYLTITVVHVANNSAAT